MRKLVFVCICIALASCGVQIRKTSQPVANATVRDLTYTQDPTTHQCFAVVSTSHWGQIYDTSATITYVPCTAEVLAKIGH